MADRTAATLARTVRLAARRVAKPAPDADLLAAFVRSKDPAAFEGLVRRHGSLVLAACRAVLSDPADADDACQAAFVVLHRKAHTVRDARTLGGWLFRVARRSALEVKAAAARRRDREAHAARPEPLPAPDLSWREACAVLHEELDRLPPRYRLPLLLCYLEGKTRDEAATELGWTADSVRGRLNRGRERLRKCLEKRGVTLSAGLIAAVAVPAGVSPRVFAAVAAPSPVVSAVAQAVASTTRVWPIGTGLSLAAGLLVGAMVLGSGRGDPPATDGPPPKNEAPPAARLDAAGDSLPDGAVARLGTVRFNHGDGLRVLVYTPDGKTVVSIGNGVARVWDAATGAERLTFSTGSTDWDENAIITPDGKELVLLVQRFQDDPVRRFDLSTGKPVGKEVTLSIRRGEMSVSRRNALSPDGRLAALPSQSGLFVYDTTTGQALWYDPRGSNLSGFGGGPHDCPMAFAGPDLLVTGLGSLVQIRDARGGVSKKDRSFDAGERVGTLIASPDGRLVATWTRVAGQGVSDWPEKDVIRVWDVATRKRVHELTVGPKQAFMHAAFSPDGKSLAGYTQSPAGATTAVWDTATGKQIARLPDVVGQALAFSPDGKRLAVGANVGKFDVYDLSTGKPVGPADGFGWWAGAVHLSRTGDRAVTVANRAVTTWDLTTGRPLTSVAVPEHLYEKPWCRFSPDGRYAVMVRGGDLGGSVVVWDVAAAKVLHTIPVRGETHYVQTVFSEDSTRLAVWLPGYPPPHVYSGPVPILPPTITVRDLKTGSEVANVKLLKVESRGPMFFADRGQTLIVTGKRTVGYRLPDGAERFAWTMDPERSKTDMGVGVVGGGGGFMQESDRLAWRTILVTPDGSLAACVLSAGWAPDAKLPDRLALCDVRTGKVIRRWGDSGRQSNGYEVLAFSPDGRLLASSDKYDVHVWEVATGKRVRTFRGHRNEIESLKFSGNGRRLASAAHDSTVLVWDVSGPSKGDPAEWWTDLASDDPAIAYAAVGKLADAADDVTIPLLKKHLHPVTTADAERTWKLITELDSDEFKTHEKAFKALFDLGLEAKPALQVARSRSPSAETVSRLDQLLANLAGPPSAGESLRTGRALAVLEAKGTPEAVELLKDLAVGRLGWLTAEARAAVRRMEGR
jgi:RNA polymerase sigma factor (sigma-70 family)